MINAERAEPYYPKDTQTLAVFILPHAKMVVRFGPAHRLMDREDSEPGLCEYWSFRFACGLEAFLVYHFHHPDGPRCNVYATSPDIGHILEHLAINDCITWRLDHAMPDFYLARYGDTADACSPDGQQRISTAEPVNPGNDCRHAKTTKL